jgi:hypothetical protein
LYYVHARGCEGKPAEHSSSCTHLPKVVTTGERVRRAASGRAQVVKVAEEYDLEGR